MFIDVKNSTYLLSTVEGLHGEVKGFWKASKALYWTASQFHDLLVPSEAM